MNILIGDFQGIKHRPFNKVLFSRSFCPLDKRIDTAWSKNVPQSRLSKIDACHVNVWLPLDLSNEASFYGAVATSTALSTKGRQTAQNRAMLQNMKAIKLINEWLKNPTKATSDASLAGVLGQVMYEVSVQYIFEFLMLLTAICPHLHIADLYDRSELLGH